MAKAAALYAAAAQHRKAFHHSPPPAEPFVAEPAPAKGCSPFHQHNAAVDRYGTTIPAPGKKTALSQRHYGKQPAWQQADAATAKPRAAGAGGNVRLLPAAQADAGLSTAGVTGPAKGRPGGQSGAAAAGLSC